MDELGREERKREARRRLSAQRDRAGRLRGRVVVASLICFALLWGIVFVQMATGNDPVLSEKHKVATRPKPRRSTSAGEAIETTEPPEAEPVETEPVPEAEFAPEAEPEPESEFAPEPEPEEVELEPLTTGQS